jgi:hypothetical protein
LRISCGAKLQANPMRPTTIALVVIRNFVFNIKVWFYSLKVKFFE